MTGHPVPAHARELTPEEHQERAEHCHALHERITTSLRDGRAAAWRLAEALYEFDEEAGWSALGYDTLNEYLASPEVGLSRTTYFKAVDRWRTLVVRKGVESLRRDSLEPSKVDVVLPALKTGETKTEDALDDVEALGWRDLREKYRRGGEESWLPESFRSGTPEADPQRLRHCFGSTAVRAFPLSDVQAMLGHAHVTTTMRYVHHRPGADDAAKLSAAFAGGDPVPRAVPRDGEHGQNSAQLSHAEGAV